MTWWPQNWAVILVPDAPIAELLVRGTVIYLLLLVAMRCVGRRLMGRFRMTDVLVTLLIAVSVRQGLTGAHYAVGDALVAAFVIVGWDLLLDWLSFRWPPLRRILWHRSQEIARAGELLTQGTGCLFLTRDDVLPKLRARGVTSLDDVETAWLEPDGSLTVVTRGE